MHTEKQKNLEAKIKDITTELLVAFQIKDEAKIEELKTALRDAIEEEQALKVDSALSETETGTGEPPLLFFSYAHVDERYLKKLLTHLAVLKRAERIADWHDRMILPGDEWKHRIDEHLAAADIILLLGSADFLASDYCYTVEMKRALERHEAGQARVIPIRLRPAVWSDTPFAKLQALPRNKRAVTTWKNRDAAWVDVAKGIRRAIDEIWQQRRKDKDTS